VPSFAIRAHGSPEPGATAVQPIGGGVLACCAVPPTCSKQTSALGHAHAADTPDPPPDPAPANEPHTPGEHVHDGSFGGHAQPVPNHMQAVSV
jgi:hypothetical protein